MHSSVENLDKAAVFVFYYFHKENHKLSGLKHKSIILNPEVPHRSHWANIKVPSGLCSFLEGLEENLFPYYSQILEAMHIPWFLEPFLHLQSQQSSVKSQKFLSYFGFLLPCLLTFQFTLLLSLMFLFWQPSVKALHFQGLMMRLWSPILSKLI